MFHCYKPYVVAAQIVEAITTLPAKEKHHAGHDSCLVGYRIMVRAGQLKPQRSWVDGYKKRFASRRKTWSVGE